MFDVNKYSSLFFSSISDEEKSLSTLTAGVNAIKLFV